MNKATVKSGKEVLEDFFSKIKEVKGVDPDTANAVLELVKGDRLTAKNLANSLAELRDKGDKNENK